MKRLVFNVFDHLENDDYFQYGFGYDCVDEGVVAGITGHDPNAWFSREIEREAIWPYHQHGEAWDEDTLFDVVEAMHDLCAQPTDGRFHGFNDCGFHASAFSHEDGQASYREQMNPVLARYERPLELNATGRLVELVPSEFRPLLKASIPTQRDSDTQSRIDDAVALFRGRSATKADRRRAVRELADVLEPLRGDLKVHALPKDERELFHIANGFAIRHNNRDQRGQYDDVIWLRWAFYIYLATIHAVLRLRAREQNSSA